MEYREHREFPERAQPPMPNDSASRYGPAEEPAYEGFHTYATSDLYDTNGDGQHWPDNWPDPQRHNAPATSRDGGGADRDYWGVLMWTILWYSIPALVLILRALFLPAGSAARAAALGDFISNSPLWLLALLGGLGLALVLRWASDTWRAATIGFCAAVVSGGAITVLYRIW
ncbi:hypothetical protein [Allorhizocola rhizosphaerae]|uniref:hypothetical protein n=1 Tax=Allorhizocola rhizosphaerae TaxID=1872709 RepID=UPI000E3E582A|nr:hypothetical protein [Allorhizocola rhizosphaerae]